MQAAGHRRLRLESLTSSVSGILQSEQTRIRKRHAWFLVVCGADGNDRATPTPAATVNLLLPASHTCRSATRVCDAGFSRTGPAALTVSNTAGVQASPSFLAKTGGTLPCLGLSRTWRSGAMLWRRMNPQFSQIQMTVARVRSSTRSSGDRPAISPVGNPTSRPPV